MLSAISDPPRTYTGLNASCEPTSLFLQKQGVSSLQKKPSNSYWLRFSYLLFAGSVSKRIVLWMLRLASVHCSGDPTISTTYSKIRTVPQILCHVNNNSVTKQSVACINVNWKRITCSTVPVKCKFLLSCFTKSQLQYLKLTSCF